MKTELLKRENILIKETLEGLNTKISLLTAKLENVNKSTPFMDQLRDNFSSGMVGYMSKKDSNKKYRELEKYTDSLKEENKIKEEIKSLEFRLKKLNTGNYLLRKNGLLVDSYKCLIDKKEAFEVILKTGKLKDKILTNEEKGIIKDLRKENLVKINKRIK